LKKKFFSPLPKGYNAVLEAQKTIFWNRIGFPDFIFLFLGELGTCLEDLILMRDVEPYENGHFPQGGMLKFTYKGYFFFTLKEAYEKLLY
jgi:hypothetical protein